MKSLLARFGWWRVIAMAVAALPLLILPLLGMAWLWQSALLPWWLLAVLAATLIGWALNRLAVAREQHALPDAATLPGAHWPAEAEACWDKVQALADEATIDTWPLHDGAGMMRLAREVLVMVAAHFNPRSEQPLLEMTLPHTLTIIERAARELRDEIVQHVPFSHRLTLGAALRAKQYRDLVKRHEGWYRAARAVLAPQSALVGELRRVVFDELAAHGSAKVQTWLLREYIRKLGYHAIELYGGLVRIGEPPAATSAPAGVLRVLVLGRSNAGKSSLINALFGELAAATDLLPDTTGEITPYRLDRDGALRALILDTPGFDGPLFAGKTLRREAGRADLILWVTAAHRADRGEERARLDELRRLLSDPTRRTVPILVVMSHIDRLRPPREWQPPYVLHPPSGTKAEQIAAALRAVADALAVNVARVIPVCLAEGRVYNVDDALWAAILHDRDAADRVRLLRCLRADQRDENWTLLWRQLGNAGRVLSALPSKAARVEKP